jgi:hypothetical protein
MQISGISSISFNPPIAPIQRTAGTDLSSLSTAASSTGKPSAARASAPVAPSAPGAVVSKAAPTGGAAYAASQSHGGGGGGQTSSATVEEDTLAAVYSTNVGGKSYSGSVTATAGDYTASVPNLQGATATGSSVEAAENNLSFVIDTLV